MDRRHFLGRFAAAVAGFLVGQELPAGGRTRWKPHRLPPVDLEPGTYIAEVKRFGEWAAVPKPQETRVVVDGRHITTQYRTPIVRYPLPDFPVERGEYGWFDHNARWHTLDFEPQSNFKLVGGDVVWNG